MVESKRRLGKYSLVAEIARGAMGIVYLAETTDPPVVPPQNARASRPPPSFEGHTLFCVKRLRSDLDDEEKFKAMFTDEARLATRLVHRNIVYTHETGDDGERRWLVMEYLEGRTLQSALRLRGEQALPLPTILRIVCNVLAGLHYAHEVTDDEGAPLGIVHRDVSAHNVFLTYDGQVKVLDFGVAQAFGRTSHTDAGGIRGRITCLAPERVTSEETVDRRADVFSVGVLLREALTGQPVWSGSEVEVLRDLIAKKIPPFPEDADVASELREIVERAMAPDRDQRFRTAHAMRAAIEQYVARVDPSGSLATMSEVLQRVYATHRVHARKVIEDHFAQHTPADIDALSVPPLPDLPSFPSSSASIAAAIASSLPPPSVAASEPPPEVILLETFGRPPLASDAGMPLLDDAPPEPTPPPMAPRVRRPRRRSFVYVGSVAAVVLAMVAVYVARPRRPLLAPASPANVVAAATSATPETEQLELRVHTTPTAAQIIVDEVVVGASSWRGLFARGTKHAVRVVAAGHAPKTSQIMLDQPLVLNVQLEPMAVPAPATAPPIVAGPRQVAPRPVAVTAPTAPPEPEPAAPAPDVFTGGQAPQRPIDPKSPYE